jgi:hypothetical protein
MPDANLQPFAERRSDPRQFANERARILLEGVTRGCIVQDISAGGARLGLGAEGPLPLRFELEFVQRKRRVPVQLIWQRGLTAGICFDLRPTLRERFDVLSWFRGKQVRQRRAAGRVEKGLVLRGKGSLTR